MFFIIRRHSLACTCLSPIAHWFQFWDPFSPVLAAATKTSLALNFWVEVSHVHARLDGIVLMDLSWLCLDGFVLMGSIRARVQAGFAMFEGGLVQRKSQLTVLLKNLLDNAFVCAVWYAIGYGLAYGGSGTSAFIGDSTFFVGATHADTNDYRVCSHSLCAPVSSHSLCALVYISVPVGVPILETAPSLRALRMPT